MAKKNQMQAMVKYNHLEDSFELWIRTGDDDFSLSCSTKCRAIRDGADAEFIHFSFMKKILECIALGYEVFEAQ